MARMSAGLELGQRNASVVVVSQTQRERRVRVLLSRDASCTSEMRLSTNATYFLLRERMDEKAQSDGLALIEGKDAGWIEWMDV